MIALKPALFFFLLFSLLPFSFAGQDLVKTTGDFVFSNVLPGFEYERELRIEWAVPAEFLNGVKAEEIAVEVSVSSLNNLVLFPQGDSSTSSLDFQLTCVLKDGSCDEENSVLKKTFSALLIVPRGAPEGFSEPVLVIARLKQAEPEVSSPSAVPSEVPSPSILPEETPSPSPEATAVATPPPKVQTPPSTGGFTFNQASFPLGIAALVLLAIGILLDKFAK
ncbi:MAG: hypothetical protein V1717_04525 [Candidatus Micrarchaeota archaeon]